MRLWATRARRQVRVNRASQPATLTQPPSLRPEDSQLSSQWCIIGFYTCLQADLHVSVPIFLARMCSGWSEASRPPNLVNHPGLTQQGQAGTEQLSQELDTYMGPSHSANLWEKDILRQGDLVWHPGHLSHSWGTRACVSIDWTRCP